MQPIPPDTFLGVGGSGTATHVGYFPFLPSINFLNIGYYAPDFPQTLLSLGHLQACGGAYTSSINPNDVKIYAIDSDPSSLIDTAPLTLGSNLLPTSAQKLESNLSRNPLLSSATPSQVSPTSFPHSLRTFISRYPYNKCPPKTASPTIIAALIATPQRPQFLKSIQAVKQQLFPATKKPSAAELRDAAEALELHEALAHPPDDKLCHDLSIGKHPHSSLTCTAVRNMRNIVGPCPHCIQGRAYRPAAIHPASVSPPASHPGAVISFDPQKLSAPALGGYTHKIMMVDEKTGLTNQPGVTSKSTGPVSDAIKGVVFKTYNANGHRVDKLHGDAENINTSLRPSLGAIGINVAVNLPGEHAQRAERTTQTINDRSRAVCSALPYFLPPDLNLFLDQSVGECINHTTNKASYPLTPYEALCGLRLKYKPAPFGRCAMVLQPDDKRLVISHETGVPLKKVPLTELGVSMGLQPGTDKTLWLLANGRVVPRRAIGELFPRTYTPFGWKTKPAIYNGSPTTDFLAPSTEEPVTEMPPPQDDNPLIYNLQPILNHPQQQITDNPILPLIPALPLHMTQQTHIPIPQLSHAHNTPPTDAPDTQPTPSPNPEPQTHTPVHEPVSVQVEHPPTPPTPAPVLSQPPPKLPETSKYHSDNYLRPRKGKLIGGQFVLLKSLVAQRTGHQLRKQANFQDAALRDYDFVRQNPPPPSFNNRATDARPKPPPRQTNEFPIRKALKIFDPKKIMIGIKKETDKCFVTYKSLRPIKQSDLEPGAVFVRSQCIVREKLSGDITARIPVDGGSQPAHTFSDTYAGTSDAAHRLFTLAVAQADAAHRGKELITGSCDIPAAFINGNKPSR